MVVIVAVGQVGIGVVESGSRDRGIVSIGIRAEIREGLKALGWLVSVRYWGWTRRFTSVRAVSFARVAWWIERVLKAGDAGQWSAIS